MWLDDAACRDVHPDVFFPQEGNTAQNLEAQQTARAVCASCPVRDMCLHTGFRAPGTALEGAAGGKVEGVWGGATVGDRDTVRRELANRRRRAAKTGKG